jgi:hypothetical protein
MERVLAILAKIDALPVLNRRPVEELMAGLPK